ncbi:hypothetical protein L6452_37369 [Arctium lappa]|uniref:Uncharacterized protein n=1 Tax=Arctium lappa TaxID=4217 RepID=A0ACB8Y3U3_ARCLA|nr:hypothetical protein L6452_37369 [Arctium lappa]
MKDLTMEDRERHTAEVKGKETAETKQKDKPLRACSRRKKGIQKTNEMNEPTAEKMGTDLKDKGSASNTTIKTEGYVGYLDLLMNQLMNARGEAEKWLESATKAFPNDPAFEKYKKDLDTLFNTSRWTSSHGQNESKGEEKEFETSMAMVVYEDVYTPAEIDACWESPTFVAEVFETVETEVQKSEDKKSSSKSKDHDFVVEAPCFDLGIIPEKTHSASAHVPPNPQALTSALKSCSCHGSQDKGKKAVTFSPIPMTSYFEDIKDKDESVEQGQAALRENRREKRPADHLRSPYVQRCVDFNVTTEEKRVHGWALAALGDTL